MCLIILFFLDNPGEYMVISYSMALKMISHRSKGGTT